MSLELRFCTSRKGGQGKVGDCDTKQLTSISSFTTLIIVQLNVWPYTYPWGLCVLVGCTKTYWATITEALHYSSNFDLTTHQLIALVLFSNKVKTKLYPHLQEMPDYQITWLTQISQNSRQKKMKITVIACWTYYCSRRHSPLLASHVSSVFVSTCEIVLLSG